MAEVSTLSANAAVKNINILALSQCVKVIIISVTKLSVVIGFPCAYRVCVCDVIKFLNSKLKRY